MSLGTFSYPLPANEPVLSYAPGSIEKATLKKTLAELKSVELDIPMYIGNKEVRTNKKIAIHPPHEIKHTLGYFHVGEEKHVQQAIDAALAAKEAWANMSWENREKWHIDHIVPLSFGQNESELMMLNHYSNLRPMWIKDNILKSNKMDQNNELYIKIMELRKIS